VLADCGTASTARRKLVSLLYCRTTYPLQGNNILCFYSKDQTEHINTLYGQNVDILRKLNKYLFNKRKLYWLYRMTCFDLSHVILSFTIGL
jgi:hypothetical protein